MRAMIFLLALSAVQAGVVSRDWVDGHLALKLNDGVAEIEWLSPTAFRFARGPASLPVLPKIKHAQVALAFEDTKTTLAIRGRYLSIEVDKATSNLRILANNETVTAMTFDGKGLQFSRFGKIYGLAGPGDSQRFFFTEGYGVFVRSPQNPTFELTRGNIELPSEFEIVFYYGPTAKEIFEQHQLVIGAIDADPQTYRMPPAAAALPDIPIDSWAALEQLVRTLHQWSLADVLYPALNLRMLDARGELGKRAADLATILPIVYGDKNQLNAAEREAWMPYLVTYCREAFDRGYPLIRPLPVQFSRDKILDPEPDVFMLGDEVLLAPVIKPGPRRSLHLPRGVWTDLRTNNEYQGNRDIEVESPTGQVPTFARIGAILPIAARHAMELHYFPDLGGEFFLWESDKKENSQFHAAPAGDFTRVEMESKVPRTYEWVLHHTKRPAKIEGYQPVKQRSALKAGTWWHDDSRNDLHIMVHADADVDTIVNVAF